MEVDWRQSCMHGLTLKGTLSVPGEEDAQSSPRDVHSRRIMKG